MHSIHIKMMQLYLRGPFAPKNWFRKIWANGRAGCLETCLSLETRRETRFWVSRSRYANASSRSRSRTLKVSENGHVSIETWKNFGFETAFKSLIRKQQWYLPDVFKVKHCAWFRTLQKHLATFCLDHFALLFRPAELQAFAFFL